MSVEYRCPQCGGSVEPAKEGFIEVGEYDGKSYEYEGSVGGFLCLNCNLAFWIGSYGPEIDPKAQSDSNELGKAIERTRDGTAEG